MASNGTENSLEKISGKNLVQGPILKRSEMLRKWNERWMILDPTTGKMEYKTRRNETVVKGSIIFDANSTITLSPVNFQSCEFLKWEWFCTIGNSCNGGCCCKLNGTVVC